MSFLTACTTRYLGDNEVLYKNKSTFQMVQSSQWHSLLVSVLSWSTTIPQLFFCGALSHKTQQMTMMQSISYPNIKTDSYPTAKSMAHFSS